MSKPNILRQQLRNALPAHDCATYSSSVSPSISPAQSSTLALARASPLCTVQQHKNLPSPPVSTKRAKGSRSECFPADTENFSPGK
jgi:hypothetical protein